MLFNHLVRKRREIACARLGSPVKDDLVNIFNVSYYSININVK